MRWLLVLALAVASAPSVARAQVVEVCEAPWLDAARLVEALRIEVGEVDATFRIDECGSESARVSIVRQGRTLVRLVPFGDTPDALRVRLFAIVLAELLHTDEALRELSRAEGDAPAGPATNRTGNANSAPVASSVWSRVLEARVVAANPAPPKKSTSGTPSTSSMARYQSPSDTKSSWSATRFGWLIRERARNSFLKR